MACFHMAGKVETCGIIVVVSCEGSTSNGMGEVAATIVAPLLDFTADFSGLPTF